MYGDRVELYDRIYAWKDYDAEATALHERLVGRGIGDGALLVDAACGTGSHLVAFSRWYRVGGFDLEPAMVTVARQKLPDAHIVVGDLVNFTLPEPADAITCLFSAIGYVHGEQALGDVARGMYRGLRPGGVALVENWLAPDQLIPNHTSLQTVVEDEPKIARAARHELRDDRSVFDFHWLVVHPTGVEHFVEHHEMAIRTEQELCAPFQEAGFTVEYDAAGISGRGLLAATKLA